MRGKESDERVVVTVCSGRAGVLIRGGGDCVRGSRSEPLLNTFSLFFCSPHPPSLQWLSSTWPTSPLLARTSVRMLSVAAPFPVSSTRPATSEPTLARNRLCVASLPARNVSRAQTNSPAIHASTTTSTTTKSPTISPISQRKRPVVEQTAMTRYVSSHYLFSAHSF